MPQTPKYFFYDPLEGKIHFHNEGESKFLAIVQAYLNENYPDPLSEEEEEEIDWEDIIIGKSTHDIQESENEYGEIFYSLIPYYHFTPPQSNYVFITEDGSVHQSSILTEEDYSSFKEVILRELDAAESSWYYRQACFSSQAYVIGVQTHKIERRTTLLHLTTKE